MSDSDENEEFDEHFSDKTCPVCKKNYADPKLLPCLHTVCRGCLTRSYGVGVKKGEVKCPVCKEKITLASNGFDGLPKNVLVLQRRLEEIAQGESDGETKCQNCTDNSVAVSWCEQCLQFLCDKCTDAHKRVAPFRRHGLISMADLGENFELERYKRMVVCRKHKKKVSKFCRTCKVATCVRCSEQEHVPGRGHDVVKLATAGKHYRESIHKLQHDMNKRSKLLRKYLEYLDEEKSEIDRDKNSAERDLERLFDHLSRSLHQQRRRMETKLEAARRLKEEMLEESEKQLQESVQNLELARSISRDTLKTEGSPDVVAMMGQVASRMNDLVVSRVDAKHRKSRRGDDPALKFVTDNPKINTFYDLIAHLGEVRVNSYIPPTIIEPDEEDSVVCGQRYGIILVSFGGDQQLEKHAVHAFRAELHDPDDIILSCQLKSTRSGTYRCEFRPQVPGWHILTVKLSGRNINGSPFKFDVAHNEFENEVDGSEFDCGNLGDPTGVAMHHGKLYVTDPRNKRVVVFNSLLEYEEKIELPFSPYDIAFDSSGSLVMSDQVGNAIYTCDVDGEVLSKIKSSQLKNVCGVAVDRHDNVLVADSASNCIFVFQPDGELQQRIGKPGKGSDGIKGPTFLAVDKSGYVYVSDSENHRVTVYSSNGHFLRYFSISGHGRGRLDHPMGIARDRSGHVLVSDSANRVTVYTIEGTFVTCIDSDTEENKLDQPHGLVTLGDGCFVVADTGNGSIKKYRYV
ncbi:tripartite motif-containing protein 2-like [Ptychodera flava]|uniref:tripartite motif-containing protein 2-like n=1 Tax=Ptychodera flava TaxID=63121 RepID=UPI00396A0C6A